MQPQQHTSFTHMPRLCGTLRCPLVLNTMDALDTTLRHQPSCCVQVCVYMSVYCAQVKELVVNLVSTATQFDEGGQMMK